MQDCEKQAEACFALVASQTLAYVPETLSFRTSSFLSVTTLFNIADEIHRLRDPSPALACQRLELSKMGLLATSLQSSAAILAIVFVIYYVVSTYLNYRKLAHIKGPWLACISPLWLFYKTVKGRVNLAGEEVLRKYGSLPYKEQSHRSTR